MFSRRIFSPCREQSSCNLYACSAVGGTKLGVFALTGAEGVGIGALSLVQPMQPTDMSARAASASVTVILIGSKWQRGMIRLPFSTRDDLLEFSHGVVDCCL